MTPDEAAVHGYLCADGYVVRNPPSQKRKNYRIGFRNTEEILLLDFQKKFAKVFKKKPTRGDGVMYLYSKELVNLMLSKESFYSREWRFPSISDKSLQMWLRAFFDCEAWVELQPYKSRSIRADSVNKIGILQIQKALRKLGVVSQVTMRRKDMVRLNICGKENLKTFSYRVGFLHPRKAGILKQAINSYKNYHWDIPKGKKKLIGFIKTKSRNSGARRQVRLSSIIKNNLTQLQKELKKIEIHSTLSGPQKSGTGSIYYSLSIPYSSLEKEDYGLKPT